MSAKPGISTISRSTREGKEAFLAVTVARIRRWVDKGGPEPADYPQLDALIESVYRRSLLGDLEPGDLAVLHDAFGEAFSAETLQGFSLRKPHGYPGDFEIIERIYSGHVCANARLANWDRYYQAQAGPQAVRNRKAYFVDLFRRMPRPEGRPLEILNLASGPGTDMRELFLRGGGEGLEFECVEQDPAAISSAFRACREFGQRVRFCLGNACSFKPARAYDVIWSAGLFDYFGDGLFKRMVKRMLPALRPGGRMIIGNFSPVNPSRAYMHLFDWPLNYRSAEDLRKLAWSSGAGVDRIRVDEEPLGVNLFLHIVAPQALV